MASKSKPRIAAYGMYIMDPSGIALRAWFDYRRKVVCTVAATCPQPLTVRIYSLVCIKPIVLADLFAALAAENYSPVHVDRDRAYADLSRRYDCERHYPLSAGPEAGIKERRAVIPKTTRRRPRKGKPGLLLPGMGS